MGQPQRYYEGLDAVGRGFESNLSNPELEHYIQRAKMGNLPLPRPLKYWEPDKLNDRHITMLFMRAAGLPQKRIGELLGYDPAVVSVVINHPYSQFLLNKMLAYAAQSVIDMDARIKAAGPEALDTVLEVMRDEDEKGAVRSSNAFKLLEIGGYGAQKETKHTHEIKLPAAKTGLLTDAIREATEIEDAEWHFVDSEGETPEGEAESEEPERDQGTSASAETPPLGGSQPLLPSGQEDG